VCPPSPDRQTKKNAALFSSSLLLFLDHALAVNSPLRSSWRNLVLRMEIGIVDTDSHQLDPPSGCTVNEILGNVPLYRLSMNFFGWAAMSYALMLQGCHGPHGHCVVTNVARHVGGRCIRQTHVPKRKLNTINGKCRIVY